MDREGISRRYAKAIYDIAESSEKVGEIREVLNILTENLEEEEEFKNFLSDPSINLSEKEKFIERTFDFADEISCNVVKYIVKKGRLPLSFQIKESFLKIYYEKNNKLPVTGIFAKELSDVQKYNLRKKLESKYKRKIVLNLLVDEDLIGGGIIKVGNKIIDGSIKNQIGNIKKVF